jgi:hypothetical protein
MAFAASVPSCGICGSTEIATDEVWERGLWLLAECGRCANRWTEGPLGGPRGPVARALAVPAEERAAAA